MKKTLALLILFIIYPQNYVFSQASAGSKSRYESRFIIDMPNAGVLSKSNYVFNSIFQENGNLLIDFSYALFTNFNLGLSYSANNLIGSSELSKPSYPSINLKFRFLDETISMPAFTLGFTNQGRGYFIKNNRSQVISPGLYLAISKNYKNQIGMMSLHTGITYSFDEGVEKKIVNPYFGIEQSLSSNISILGELNTNINEIDNNISKGMLLNTAIRWSINSNLTFEFHIKDLLKSQKSNQNMIRTIGFEYIERF